MRVASPMTFCSSEPSSISDGDVRDDVEELHLLRADRLHALDELRALERERALRRHRLEQLEVALR